MEREENLPEHAQRSTPGKHNFHFEPGKCEEISKTHYFSSEPWMSNQLKTSKHKMYKF